MGGGNLSVVWSQPVGFMQVVGRERVCGSYCSFEESRSMREEMLTSGSEKTST
jgi:hypothetical protein